MNRINSGKGGLALITVILIVVLLAIVVFGMASFISNSMAMSAATVGRAQAIAAAQAGVYAAIYDYQTDSLWDVSASTNIYGNVYYSVGGGTSVRQSDFLLIDADNPAIVNGGGTDNQLQRIPLSNVNASQSISVKRMKVDWGFGGTLTSVGLGAVAHSVSASTGNEFDISPTFTIAAHSSFTADAANYWRFSNTIPMNAVIAVTFYFNDPLYNSTRKAYLYNNGRSGNKEFLITSTGESRMNVTWKRTVEATYDVGVSRITSWQETESHL